MVNQDVLELTNEAYTKLSTDAYLLVAKRMPWVLGWVYDVNDVPNEQPLRKLCGLLNTQPVVRYGHDRTANGRTQQPHQQPSQPDAHQR